MSERITFLSRMTVKAGFEEQFERATMALQVATKANEKDAIYYEFFKLREERRYAVLESFPNEAAEHAHLETPWFKDAVSSIIECLDGTIALTSCLMAGNAIGCIDFFAACFQVGQCPYF